MRKHFLSILLISSVWISSCTVVGNLYPISENENDFVFKKEIIGKWGKTGNSTGFYQVDTVAGSNGKLYKILLVNQNEQNKNNMDSTVFTGKLIQVNNWYFMDCQMDINANFPKQNDDYSSWLIARHFLYNISFIGSDKIELTAPDPDVLINLINNKKLNLNYHIQGKDDYLILNKPSELQTALKESLNYASTVYKGKEELVRLK